MDVKLCDINRRVRDFFETQCIKWRYVGTVGFRSSDQFDLWPCELSDVVALRYVMLHPTVIFRQWRQRWRHSDVAHDISGGLDEPVYSRRSATVYTGCRNKWSDFILLFTSL